MGFCCITNMQTGATNNKRLPMSCWAFGDTPRTFTLPLVMTYFWFLQWSFPALLKCFISPLLLFHSQNQAMRCEKASVSYLPTHPSKHISIWPPSTQAQRRPLPTHGSLSISSLHPKASRTLHITSPSNVFPPLYNINIKASPILTKWAFNAALDAFNRLPSHLSG